METVIIQVEGMHCAHCEAAVKGAVGQLPGVSRVQVDLAGKTVTVDYDPAQVSKDQFAQAIDDQGFDVVA